MWFPGVLVQMGLTSSAALVQGVAVARNEYRRGLAQVNVVLDPVLRDRMRLKASRNGRSMSEEFRLAALSWLGEVSDGGDGGAVPGFGRLAEADERGSGCAAAGDGPDHAGVGPVGVVRPLTGAERLALIVAQGPSRPVDAPGIDEPLPVEDWVDPAEGIA